MTTKISLEAEQYSDFIRCLTNLKEECNDVDIREGIIRQRTNGNTSIFEIDVTSMVDDISIAITDLKTKLDLLKTFQGQEVDIEITPRSDTDPGNFIFSDQYSSIKIVLPTPEFIDNKFMGEEELKSIFNSTEEDLIMEYDIPQIISDRISLITDNFNVKSIRVDFNGDTADLTSENQARDQRAKFVTEISTNVEMPQSLAYISVIPFSIDHDSDIEYKMYKDANQNVALNQFSTTLGQIDINIYSRASIIEEED